MGLRFDTQLEVSPEEPLDGPFAEWVTVLFAGHPATTVRAYVGDIAGVCERLLQVLGRPVPRPRDGNFPPMPDLVSHATRSRLSPVTFFRAADAIAYLQLGDLHPRNLGMVFDTLGADRAAVGVRRAAAAMSNFCDYLVRRDLLAENPMRSRQVHLPTPGKSIPHALSLDEVQRLVDAVQNPPAQFRTAWPARDLAVLAVLVGTGVRLSEITSACVGDLTRTLTGPSLRVLGKGSKMRVVFLPDEAYSLTRAYLDERASRTGTPGPSDVLFVRVDGSAFTPRSFQYMVDRWFTRAGIHRPPGASVHLMRHTFASLALSSGSTIREVQECLGHVSLETTRRYLAVTGEQVASVAVAHPVRGLLS